MQQVANQRTVLVVEDEFFIRMSAVAMLEDAGFRVREARDSAEALTMLARHDEIDVLMTDVRMPGRMDGLALVAQVCIAYPTIHSIVVSANGSAAQASDAGAVAFVPKPYTARAIVEAVHETACGTDDARARCGQMR
jgi:two-component system, response regulator PdtaR